MIARGTESRGLQESGCLASETLTGGEGGGVVSLRDRFAASVATVVPIIIAFGAKAALVGLILLAVAAWMAAWRPSRSLLPTLAELAAWPAVLLCLFVLLCWLSMLWADYPLPALAAGGDLLIVVLIGQMLRAGFKRLSPDAAVLVGGWFAVGAAIGVAVLTSELLFDFAIQKTLFEAFPDFQPDQSSMIYVGGKRFDIAPEVANWSVAGIAMLAWPVLLIVRSVAGQHRRHLLTGVFGIAVLLLIFISEHETSKLAAIVSLAAFLAARAAPDGAPKVAAILTVAFLAVVVPLTQGAVATFKLDQAAWAQFSLKERFRIWNNVSQNVLEQPVFGIGADNTTTYETLIAPSAAPQGRPVGELVVFHHPHSVFLQAWLEFGLIGALLFGALLLAAFGMVLAAPVEARTFAFASLAAVLTEAAATWDLWSIWLLAMITLAFCVLGLGLRLRLDGSGVAFGKIWLPRRGAA